MVLARAEKDEGFRKTVAQACAVSPKVFCNLMCWTYVMISHSAKGRVSMQQSRDEPFITWPCQDDLLDRWHQACNEGTSLLVPKSREMGASWLLAGVDAVHYCMFTPKSQARVLSRKEALVEDKKNPDALLWKVDYLLRHLPDWLRPPMHSPHLIRAFLHNESLIAGEATSKYAGAGGRGQRLYVDEAAQIDNLDLIERSTQDTAGSKVFISTPRLGTHFAKMRRDGRIPEHGLWWWDHPEKGAGRVLVTDPITGEKRYTSPWYEAEAAKRDERSIAENLAGEDVDASRVVFSTSTIAIHQHRFGKPPNFRGVLALPPGSLIDPTQDGRSWPVSLASMRVDPQGPWRMWLTLINGKPRPDRQRVFGVDVARGTQASNSVISVVDCTVGAKVARFSSSRLSPSELADLLFIAGHWFGNAMHGLPLIAIESNGAGEETIIRLRKLGYPNLYRHSDGLDVSRKPDTKYGWSSTRARKKHQLGLYRDALARHELQNPDVEALEEASDYVYYEDGGVGPLNGTSETEEARSAHGDIVIADMLAHLASTRTTVRAPSIPFVDPAIKARVAKPEASKRLA